jgi:hypothetical protein
MGRQLVRLADGSGFTRGGERVDQVQSSISKPPTGARIVARRVLGGLHHRYQIAA